MIKFNRSEFRALSVICGSIGQVFFGGVIAGFSVLPIDLGRALVLLFELAFALISWYLAFIFARKGKL